MAKPDKYPDWNTGGSNRAEPSAPKKTAGWAAGEEPPSTWFNWLLYYLGAWARFFYDEMLSPQHTDAGAHKDVTALSVAVDLDQNVDSGVTVENDQGGTAASSSLKLTSNSGAYGIFLQWWKLLAGIAPVASLKAKLPNGQIPHLRFHEALATTSQVELYGHDGSAEEPIFTGYRKGEITVGKSHATTATEGFFLLGSCAGTPTGVPVVLPAGFIPTLYDSTSKKLYAYIGGGWVGVPLVPGGEPVSVRYVTESGQSIADNAAPEIIDFSTKVYDDPGVDRVATGTSWKFTADRNMKVYISAQIELVSSGWLVGDYVDLVLYKNNSLDRYLFRFYLLTSAIATLLKGETTILLANGDYLDLRVYQNSGGAATLSVGYNANWIDIHEIP